MCLTNVKTTLNTKASSFFVRSVISILWPRLGKAISNLT